MGFEGGWPESQTVALTVLLVPQPLAKPEWTGFLSCGTQMLPPEPVCPSEEHSRRGGEGVFVPCEPLLSVLLVTPMICPASSSIFSPPMSTIKHGRPSEVQLPYKQMVSR